MSTNFATLLQAGRKLAHTSQNTRSRLNVAKKDWPFIPTRKAINRYHSGTKLGRLGRHIFEHKWINRILGSNLAIVTILSSMLQAGAGSTLAAVDIQPVAIKAQNISLVTSRGVQKPLANIKINQGYRFFHPGVDFDGSTGDPVKPVMPGKVNSAGYSRIGYGNSVIVDHGNGVTSLYAHLSKIEVKTGQEVTMNTEIGKVGSTGRSTGSHLHLEIREDGKAINPLAILPQ